MRKIPTLLARDFTRPGAPVTGTLNPDCEWVLNDQERVTVRQKFDGTCVRLDDAGAWWGRREVKPEKAPPPGWVEVDADEVTGKRVGWEPIAQTPFVKPFGEALRNLLDAHTETTEYRNGEHVEPFRVEAIRPTLEAGTYELIGPKINGNPEGCERHELVAHDGRSAWSAPVVSAPTDTVQGIVGEVFLLWQDLGAEGLVFTHEDGRRAKIKARDFGWGR